MYHYRYSNLHFMKVPFYTFLKFCPTELDVAGVIYKFHMYYFDLVTYSWCLQSVAASIPLNVKTKQNNKKQSE